jgi:purine-nucleoside phosphorylase
MDKEYSHPDKELTAVLKKVLKKENVPFLEGVNISVPAVTLQPKHKNKDYERIKPLTLEMETAAFFSRANHIGIRSACVLIVSDNKESSLKDNKKRELRRECKRKIASAIIRNIEAFNLKPLKHADEFNIDEYLAEIIETDDISPNVYRK